MKTIKLFIFACFYGLIVVCVASTGLHLLKVHKCEQNLPRTQQCVLVAVPEDSL